MQLLSIQVGKVQTHDYNGKEWTTGYIKKPVVGRVRVNKLNIEGDAQHNLKVHGGEHRAVLMYSAEHYDTWQSELDRQLPYGSFAENFTVSGMTEDTVCIGDVFQVGDTVRLQVAQPRQPCNQIYMALGIRGIRNKVDTTRQAGWYLRVLEEGDVEAGMPITLLERPHPDWSVERVYSVMDNRVNLPKQAAELAQIDALNPDWRKRLARVSQG